MFELFKSEIWRLKLWIVVPALFYLLLNGASIYFGEYIDSGLMIGIVHSVIFAISSLLLGLFQFHTYKKPSRWMYLINRPASLSALCLVLLATGSVIVLFQFVIPDLLLTLTMDNLSSYLIESRHYFQSIYVLFISLAFYLSGVFIQLSHSKGGFLVLALPITAMTSLLLNGPVIIISFIAMLWLLLLVLSVFKANTSNNKTTVIGKILTIIPFQLGLYFILVMALAFVFQFRLMLIDGAGIDVSWNEYFANDVHKHVEGLEGHEQMILSLENADKDVKDKYNKQLKNSETYTSVSRIKLFYPTLLLPYQQKIKNLNIKDPVNESNWVFSFDQMTYVDTSLNNNNSVMLRENGEVVQFNTVPNVINNNYGYQVVTENEIYSYDSDFQQLNLRFSLKDNETFISGFNYSNSTVNVITTKNMYIFDSEEVKVISKMLTPFAVVKLPDSYENLNTIDIAEMIDSTLIGFLYGKLSDKGHYTAHQVLVEIDSTHQQIQTLATRPLKNGFSEMYNMMNWYISPLTHWASEYAMKPQLKSKPLNPMSIQPDLKISNALKIVMVILMLFSVISVLWLIRNRDMTKSEMLAWIVLTCFTSITGLLTFLLLTDKKININQKTN